MHHLVTVDQISFPQTPLPWLVGAHVLPHDYSAPFRPIHFAFALMLSVYMIGRCLSTPTAAPHWIRNWTAGLALLWALLAFLLLPWIDAAKSYRTTLAAALDAAPSQFRCIDSIELGESERAMLHYYFAISAVQISTPSAARCDLLLVEHGGAGRAIEPDPVQWKALWRGNRPGDVNERFALYRSLQR